MGARDYFTLGETLVGHFGKLLGGRGGKEGTKGLIWDEIGSINGTWTPGGEGGKRGMKTFCKVSMVTLQFFVYTV